MAKGLSFRDFELRWNTLPSVQDLIAKPPLNPRLPRPRPNTPKDKKVLLQQAIHYAMYRSLQNRYGDQGGDTRSGYGSGIRGGGMGSNYGPSGYQGGTYGGAAGPSITEGVGGAYKNR